MNETKPSREEMVEWLAETEKCFNIMNSHPRHAGMCAAIRSLIEQYGPPSRPKVICLCGSTRFTREMLIKQWELTKAGNVVLSWCALPDDYFDGEDKTHVGDREGVKELIDEVHKRKIDLCDEVLVINIGGYIGDSTKSEIAYAHAHGKPLVWLEPGLALSESLRAALEARAAKKEEK